MKTSVEPIHPAWTPNDGKAAMNAPNPDAPATIMATSENVQAAATCSARSPRMP
jgi:hypothetical protein